MKIYLYDGTWIGFLTLLETIYLGKIDLEGSSILNLRLLNKNLPLYYEEITSSTERALLFYNHLKKTLPTEFFKKLYIYYLCDQAQLEKPLIRVIKGTEKDPLFWKNITLEDPLVLHQTEKSLWRECHRFKGILRFKSGPNGILLAIIEPKFNILPLLYKHFVRRFPQESFYIYDRLRRLLFSYRNCQSKIMWVEELKLDESLEDAFEDLWKEYFKEIAVPERKCSKRQRNKLPLRLRKNMPEFY
ncbi:MAG: TIGR03915 family putative DNA repair protein [Caldimicrobium sp.]|nr:TIGR03915 family putative DNA repair protein [Caldimicrobium sp.]MCX7873605.1 TIGR03915 family putative DNA repair protein [Caldimicrobium sp.]MDW8095067.1 TIGR03915 family putative DNA repair protein [Caldimicrobium sp.]